MKRLGLDRVWWLVTPGNPLKDTLRLGAACATASLPLGRSRSIRVSMSPISKPDLGTSYTYETVSYLVRRCPGSVSSGSWAPTICAAFIAGSAGAALRRWCRSQSSTGSGRAFTRRRASPARRLRCARIPEVGGKDAAGTKAAGLDLSAWSQIAAVLDRLAGGRALHDN